MKMFRMLARDIRDSFRNVFRNFSLSMASISCITITLIVVGISIILSTNVNKFGTNVKEDVEIIVFLDMDIPVDDISVVQNKISKIKNVSKDSITFKSKEELRDEFMEIETYRAIMVNWTEREDIFLHDTIQVKVKDINQIEKTRNEIEKIEGVTVAKYAKDMVENLVDIFEFIKIASIAAVVALIVVTAFLISNTIKITIFSRKREIGIMRLVGASNINIKIPFIIEGLQLGILGSIIPIIIMTYGYQLFYDKFKDKFIIDVIKLQEPTPFIYYAALILLGIGAIVGMIGSLRAVKKYLKV